MNNAPHPPAQTEWCEAAGFVRWAACVCRTIPGTPLRLAALGFRVRTPGADRQNGRQRAPESLPAGPGTPRVGGATGGLWWRCPGPADGLPVVQSNFNYRVNGPASRARADASRRRQVESDGCRLSRSELSLLDAGSGCVTSRCVQDCGHVGAGGLSFLQWRAVGWFDANNPSPSPRRKTAGSHACLHAAAITADT